MSRTIVVTSGKGGVGKSSMTINLGYALASQGQKVCLIDADFGLKNLDVMMGLENRVIYDLNDVISNKCSLKQILVKDKRMDSLYLFTSICKLVTPCFNSNPTTRSASLNETTSSVTTIIASCDKPLAY